MSMQASQDRTTVAPDDAGGHQDDIDTIVPPPPTEPAEPVAFVEGCQRRFIRDGLWGRLTPKQQDRINLRMWRMAHGRE